MSRLALIVIALLLAFLLPGVIATVWLVLQWPWDSLLSVLPSVILPDMLSPGRRWFLSTLWVSGAASVGSLLWLSRRDGDRRYLAGALGVLLMCGVVTSIGMPIGERDARRWQVEEQLASGLWNSAMIDRIGSIQGLIYNRDLSLTEVRYNFSRLKPLKGHGFAYLESDVESVIDRLQLPFELPLDRARQATIQKNLLDELAWMPDQSGLWHELAMSGLLGADHEVDTRSSEWFIKLLAFRPDSREAWMGLALSILFTGSCDHESCDYTTSAIEQAYVALQISQLAQESWKADPRLSQWLEQLPRDKRELFEILRARATVTVNQSLSKDTDAAVVAMASRALPVARAESAGMSSVGYSGNKYPGRVEVDREAYGIGDGVFYGYPPVDKLIPEAVATVSIDVDPQGGVVFAVLEQSSGEKAFDRNALEFARKWRLQPADGPRKLSVPVRYVSTLRTWPEYYREMERQVVDLARSAARRLDSSVEFKQRLLLKDYRDNFPDRERFAQWRSGYRANSYNYSSLMNQFRSANPELEAGSTAFRESFIAFHKKMLEKWPGDEEPVFYLAFYEYEFYRKMVNEKTGSQQVRRNVLLDAREHFLQALLNDPESGRAWYGWGMTWLGEDPELAVGALHYALTKGGSGNLMELAIKALTQLSGSDYVSRIDVLLKRLSPNERDAGFSVALPAVPESPAPHLLWEVTAGPGSVTVDFPGAGVMPQQRVLPAYPSASDDSQQSISLELAVDVGNDGKPYSVMLSESSGQFQFDQAAVKAAWQWRFKPQQAQLMRVPVIFIPQQPQP